MVTNRPLGRSLRAHAFRLPALIAASAIALQAMSADVLANPRLVVDVKTLKVVEHQDVDRKWYPASLTKLMTAYTVFRALRAGQVSLTTPVVMTKNAAAEPPSKMFYKPGQALTLDSALKILLVKSANDIAVAISETVGGSEEGFVARMNAEAQRLGMRNSRFVNPHGLPKLGQYTTARDLAILAVTLKREFPEYAGYFALEGFTTGKKIYPNYNLLIGRFDGADGMKTGFICASGFNQVSSATRNGRSVVSVVLGADSLGGRADESARLLQEGLTDPGTNAPQLMQLPPEGAEFADVADISKQICSKEAAKVRSEGRDEVGRQKLLSPYIHEMTREPNVVFAGLIPGTEKVAGKADGKQAMSQGDAGNIPVPLPRPVN